MGSTREPLNLWTGIQSLAFFPGYRSPHGGPFDYDKNQKSTSTGLYPLSCPDNER